MDVKQVASFTDCRGVSTTLTFRAIMIRSTGEMADRDEQRKFFGILEEGGVWFEGVGP